MVTSVYVRTVVDPRTARLVTSFLTRLVLLKAYAAGIILTKFLDSLDRNSKLS